MLLSLIQKRAKWLMDEYAESRKTHCFGGRWHRNVEVNHGIGSCLIQVPKGIGCPTVYNWKESEKASLQSFWGWKKISALFLSRWCRAWVSNQIQCTQKKIRRKNDSRGSSRRSFRNRNMSSVLSSMILRGTLFFAQNYIIEVHLVSRRWVLTIWRTKPRRIEKNN